MDAKKKKDATASSNETKNILMVVSQYGKLAGIFGLAWLVGWLQCSVSWVLFVVLVYTVHKKVRSSKLGRMQVQQESVVDEQTSILARVDDVPSWVYFPDVERAEWLNKIFEQLWPYIENYIQDLVRGTMEQKIRDCLPRQMKSFRFGKISLGTIPPRIGGVKVYKDHVRHDEILLDMELFYAGNADISVIISKFEAGIKDLQIHGTIRVAMRPLINQIPLIGGMNIFFLSRPTIDFNLTSIANAFDMPGLSNVLHGIIQDQIAALLVLPNHLDVPLSQHINIMNLKYPIPQGVLRVCVVEARDLEAADFKLIGKGTSDPYCKVYVGSQSFKTKMIPKCLNPEWNEFHEYVVDQRHGQYLELECFDEDTVTKNDSLGTCVISVGAVMESATMDTWVALEGAKSGMIHLRLWWLELSSDVSDLADAMVQRQLEETLTSAMAFVFVDSAKNLPKAKRALCDPSPYAVVSVGSQSFQTQALTTVSRPVWGESFTFMLSNPGTQEITCEVFDKKTESSLGWVSIPARSILDAPDLTVHRPFSIKGKGKGESLVTLRICLRILTPGKATESAPLSPSLTSPSPRHTWNETAVTNGDMEDGVDSSTTTGGNGPTKRISVNGVATGSTGDKSAAVTNGEGGGGEGEEFGNFARSVSKIYESSHPRQRRKKGDPAPCIGEDIGKGKIQLTVRYSPSNQRLAVVIHTAEELVGCDKDGLADPYVRIYLYPDRTKHGKRKTQYIKNNLSPVFDETFHFSVPPRDLEKVYFDLAIKNHVGMFQRGKTDMGHVSVPLAAPYIDTAECNTLWFYVQSGKHGSMESLVSHV